MSSRQIKLIVPILLYIYMTLFLPNCVSVQREAVLFQSSPATIRLLLPFSSIFDHGPSIPNKRFKFTAPIPSRGSSDEDNFQMEPSDATDGVKYSQPAVGNHAESSYPASVPSNKFLKNRNLPIERLNPSHSNFKVQTLSSDKILINTPLDDVGYLDFISKSKTPKPTFPSHEILISTPKEDNVDFSDSISKSKVESHEDKLNSSDINKKFKEISSNTMFLESHNVTDSMAHLLPVSSDNVLSYENSPSSLDKNDYKYTVPVKKSSERAIEDAPSHPGYPKSIFQGSNHSTLLSTVPDAMTLSPLLSTTHFFETVNQTEPSDNGETTEVLSTYDMENISSSSISFPTDNDKFSPGTVAGIVIGVLVCATILSSAVIYLLYQKYNGKCTGVVEGKFNSDNCGYLDDSLRSSIYLNNHIELPKESSEEMSSLDNDSFLNSLETMTIQNYWADNSKNTKV